MTFVRRVLCEHDRNHVHIIELCVCREGEGGGTDDARGCNSLPVRAPWPLVERGWGQSPPFGRLHDIAIANIVWCMYGIIYTSGVGVGAGSYIFPNSPCNGIATATVYTV